MKGCRVNTDELRYHQPLYALPDYGIRRGMVVYVDDLNDTDTDGEVMVYFSPDHRGEGPVGGTFGYALPSALTPVDLSTVEGVLTFLLGSTDVPVAQ